MNDRFSADVWVAMTLLSAITIISVMLYGRPARGEMVDCASAHGGGRWVYRIIDGRKCWFPASRNIRRGEDKPREELQWNVPWNIHDGPPRNEFKDDRLRRGPSSTPDEGAAQEQMPDARAPAAAPSEFEDRWMPVR